MKNFRKDLKPVFHMVWYRHIFRWFIHAEFKTVTHYDHSEQVFYSNKKK